MSHFALVAFTRWQAARPATRLVLRFTLTLLALIGIGAATL